MILDKSSFRRDTIENIIGLLSDGHADGDSHSSPTNMKAALDEGRATRPTLSLQGVPPHPAQDLRYRRPRRRGRRGVLQVACQIERARGERGHRGRAQVRNPAPLALCLVGSVPRGIGIAAAVPNQSVTTSEDTVVAYRRPNSVQERCGAGLSPHVFRFSQHSSVRLSSPGAVLDGRQGVEEERVHAAGGATHEKVRYPLPMLGRRIGSVFLLRVRQGAKELLEGKEQSPLDGSAAGRLSESEIRVAEIRPREKGPLVLDREVQGAVVRIE